MVTSRLKEICLSAMENQFPDLEVLDFEIRKTFKYDNEIKDWVDDSYSIFIQIGFTEEEDFRRLYDVESYLTALFGFEFCIDFSQN